MLSEHPYLYCEHEPVNSVDPSGNSALDDLIAKWIERAVEKSWQWFFEPRESPIYGPDGHKIIHPSPWESLKDAAKQIWEHMKERVREEWEKIKQLPKLMPPILPPGLYPPAPFFIYDPNNPNWPLPRRPDSEC